MQTWALVLTRVRGGCVVHRCQNENPRKKGWPVDVNDVMHRKRARRILGILKKLRTRHRTRRVDFRGLQTNLCAKGTARDGGGVGWGGVGWKSQNRKNVYLSPYVEEPLNSKVIKSFVPELRSRKSFSCFGILMFYVYLLWTFCVRFPYSCMGMLHSYIYIYIYTCKNASQENGAYWWRPSAEAIILWWNVRRKEKCIKTEEEI